MNLKFQQPIMADKEIDQSDDLDDLMRVFVNKIIDRVIEDQRQAIFKG